MALRAGALCAAVVGLTLSLPGSARAGDGTVDVWVNSNGVQQENSDGSIRALSKGRLHELSRASTLILPDGAEVFVSFSKLGREEIRTFRGELRVLLSDFPGAPEARQAEETKNRGLFTKKTSRRGVGGTRSFEGASGPEPHLLRPSSNTVLGLTGSSIRWKCKHCKAPTWRLFEDPWDEDALWVATGNGHVTYDGPPLAPGETYYLQTDSWTELVPIQIASEAVRAKRKSCDPG